MADSKEVIKGLESCIKMGRLGVENCRELNCPYFENGHLSCWIDVLADALALLKEQQVKKSKEEVLLAIIGKQSYTDLEKFKQLEELNDEYFNGMLDSIRAVEKLFDTH